MPIEYICAHLLKQCETIMYLLTRFEWIFYKKTIKMDFNS